MEYRNFGHTGLKVSELCLGTMQFGWTADEAQSQIILSTALEAGINFLDTADVYSRWVKGNPGGVAEAIIGKWIKQSNIPRDQLVLATKVRGKMGSGPNDEGLSRKHIMLAVEASLSRLGIDYIDLYQVHAFDENTPIDETLRALTDLVHQGKVRYIGCSRRMTSAIVAMALLSGAAAPVSAADSRYDVGNIWYVSSIDVLDGQFENYMAWLADEWVKFRKLNALHGNEVGYHVLGNSTPRNGEPDVYLVTIHKDFLKIAEGLAVEKKINEAMAKDRAQFEKEGAARAPMRTVMGNLELIEFKLK